MMVVERVVDSAKRTVIEMVLSMVRQRASLTGLLMGQQSVELLVIAMDLMLASKMDYLLEQRMLQMLV